MSEKTLRVLVVGAILLVAAWAVSALVGRGSGGAGAHSPLQAALGRARQATVASVDLMRSTDTLALRRSEGAWTVNGHTTDTSTVRGFWTAVDSARVSELASRNPSHQEEMGVRGPDAVTLVFHRTDGDSVRILLGDSGPYYPSVYARLPGSNDVWLVRGSLRRQASRSLSDWRDRTIVRVDTSAVKAVSVVRKDSGFTLDRRGDSAWVVNGRPADTSAVRSLLGQLADVQASGFASDTVHAGRPDRMVTALGAKGDTLAALRFSERPHEGYWGTVRGRKTLYEVPRYRVERLVPSLSVVRPPPPKKVAPSKLHPAGPGSGGA